MAFMTRRTFPGALDAPAASTRAGPAMPSQLPAECTTALVTTADGFARLETAWRQLERLTPAGRHLFQSFAWLKAWSTTYDPILVIVTGFRRGDLVFAWPLMTVRVGPVRVLRWLSEPHAQYGDVLAAAGECPRLWSGEALGLLLRQSSADIIRLRHVRADALVAPFAADTFREANLEDRAPSLDLTGFADEAAYEARYSPTQRKRRKKIRKHLEERHGTLRFDVLTDPLERDVAIRAALAEKSHWVDERGRHNRVLGCPHLPEFLNRLGGPGMDASELVVSQLSAGGRPISWEIGLRAGGTHFCFITSHLNALTDLSPARLHMDLSQRRALKDGMAAFDLMVPDDPYKDSWCSERTMTRDYHLPLSPLGRLYGVGYLENLRPALREAYHHAPPRLLRLLKPVIGH